MELKTNDDHKSMDLRAIRMDLAKKIGVTLTAGELVISLLSGCGLVKKDSSISTDPSLETVEEVDDNHRIYDVPSHELDEVISINPSLHFFGTCDNGEKIDSRKTEFTYEELSHIVELNLYIYDGEYDSDDFDFLNYLPNLKKLSILDFAEGNHFEHVDGSRFASGISIEIDIPPSKQNIFSEDSYYFLKDIPSIETLRIGSKDVPIVFDSTFLQELHNVQNLALGLDGYSNFIYQDLSYLSSLELDALPYDIAMYFTNDDLEELERVGVKLSGFSISEVQEANNRIDEIVKSIDISENATDQEKLNAILLYVLENYQYDERIGNLVHTRDKSLDDESKAFYTEGEMTAGFENDTQICGNYAAITYTLGRRLGLDIHMMTSSNHAWDVIKIGDYYYYTDPTWLDGEEVIVGHQKANSGGTSITYSITTAEDYLREDNQEELDSMGWYLEDPTEISDKDELESHVPLYIPIGVELTDIPDDIQATHFDFSTQPQQQEEVEAETETKQGGIQFNVNGKIIKIGLVAGVGILSALGIGHLVNRKLEEKRRREMERRVIHSSFPTSYSHYSGSDSHYHRY